MFVPWNAEELNGCWSILNSTDNSIVEIECFVHEQPGRKVNLNGRSSCNLTDYYEHTQAQQSARSVMRTDLHARPVRENNYTRLHKVRLDSVEHYGKPMEQ